MKKLTKDDCIKKLGEHCFFENTNPVTNKNERICRHCDYSQEQKVVQEERRDWFDKE